MNRSQRDHFADRLTRQTGVTESTGERCGFAACQRNEQPAGSLRVKQDVLEVLLYRVREPHVWTEPGAVVIGTAGNHPLPRQCQRLGQQGQGGAVQSDTNT